MVLANQGELLRTVFVLTDNLKYDRISRSFYGCLAICFLSSDLFLLDLCTDISSCTGFLFLYVCVGITG